MEKKILLTNIQRFSLHDGPGIRTTVFLKGCSLRCPWCANPENIEPHVQQYCKDGQKGTYGRYYTSGELLAELQKDKVFYTQMASETTLGKLPGGVTFSGGEPLLQFAALEPVLRELKAEKIHICIETCLFAPREMLELALRYVDLFYVDIKILNAVRCRNILCGDTEQYLSNIEQLFKLHKDVIFRIPVIGGYTDGEENIDEIVSFLLQFKPLKIELIKEHNLGKSKYLSLGKKPLELNCVSDEQMERIKAALFDITKLPIEICKV